MPERTFGWQTLCKAAILEINPDKLAICDRGGRAGHRSTRISCGYYRTRASQVGGCPFNAQDPVPKIKQFTARNSLRKKRRYLHCCQPDESCQRQSLGLQPASQHILRCPARYHRCTNTGEGGTLELLYRF